MICIVVLNYNDSDTTIKFVQQIINYSIIDKIIVVDNASTDNSYSKLLPLSCAKVDILETQKNGGYGYGNNFGIKYAVQKYHATQIIVSNPDVEVSENTILHCKEVIEKRRCALVAPMMKNHDQTVNYQCVWKVPTRNQYRLFSTYFLGKITQSFYYNENELKSTSVEKLVGCVAGSFFMVNANKMLDYGMFDENIFLFCEETVLGLKLKKENQEVVVLLNDYFIHHHSVSINKSITSIVKQRKITWKSRLYVLENYYSSNRVDLLIDRIVSKLELMEFNIKHILKR